MEKDKKLEQLIKEYGLESPPENFTLKVMEKINSEPEKIVYKPLIGRFGRLLILVVILSVIVISIFYSEPSGFLSENLFHLPKWDLNIGKLPDLNISTGVLTALLAVFILVVADNLFKRRRLI